MGKTLGWCVAGALCLMILSSLTGPVTPPAPTSSSPTKSLVDPEKAAIVAPLRTAMPAPKTPSPAPSRPLPSPLLRHVTGDTVNLRAGPGTNFPVKGQVHRGDRVKVVEQSGGWARLMTFDTTATGAYWISARFLSATAPQKAAPRGSVATKPSGSAGPSASDLSRARQQMIRLSISTYSGSCACPYNRDRAGRSCGKRSAWSQPGGAAPLCYASDISDGRARAYLARQR